jgi:5,10-methylenetetrahydromethanopterin reductase
MPQPLPTTHLGVCFLSVVPAPELLRLAQVADEAGLDGFWLSEGYHYFRRLGEPSSSTSIAAAAAVLTKRITIGLGIVPPYTRHPGLLAMEARTLSTLSGGRVILGLGAAKAAALHMGWTEQTLRSVAIHRESIALTRKLLAGAAVDHQGKFYKLDAPPSPTENFSAVPIAIGATGPKMLELAGEVADLVLLPTFTTARFVKIARERIAAGAVRSGRSPETIPIGATLPFSVAEEESEAREAIRVTTAVYIANKVQNIRDDTLMRAADLSEDEAVPIAEKLQREGPQAAARMVSNAIMDKVVVAGTPIQVTDRLLGLKDAGLRWPLLYQVLGPHRAAAIKLIAQKVRPAFLAG